MKSRILLLFLALTVLLGTVGSTGAWAQAGLPPNRVEVLQNARLRASPSTSAAIAGSAQAGQVLGVKGCNLPACDWYQLENGAWIAAFLVKAAAGASDAVSGALQRPSLTALTPAVVVKIVDGDTIDVQLGSQTVAVRYIGMDTPERGAAGASEATAANEKLVKDQVVLLEKDVSETDRFGRLLRHVWLSTGNTLVNEALVRQGMAVSVSYPPDVKYQAIYNAAQAAAVRAGLGRWATAQVRPIATVRATARPAGATANRAANLRGGPGTNYSQAGAAALGQALSIVGRNAGGDWYQLLNGAWIAGFLVSNAPANVPVVATPLPPAPAPAVPLRAAPAPAPSRGNCDSAYPTVCIPPPPPDLDCGQIGFRRFQVLPPDPHRFDGDYDGVGCESG